MTCIGKGIYCRKHIHDLALNTSHKATQVARKLLEGVFKYDILRQATLTGQQPRAHGLKRRLEPVIPLDITAKSAIIGMLVNILNYLCVYYHLSLYFCRLFNAYI